MQSAVRREQRHAVQFLARLGRTTSETHQLLTTAYQDDALRKPATKTYHNRFQTLGLSVYENNSKMKKTRARRSRKARKLSIMNIENNQKINNMGSEDESDDSLDSFNNSFHEYKKDNSSETDINLGNHRFEELSFQNKSINNIEEPTSLHEQEIDHYNEKGYSSKRPNICNKEFPSSNQKNIYINNSDENGCHEQVGESFYNLDQQQGNIHLSNDNNLADNPIMGSTIAANDQYESDMTTENYPKAEISAIERTIVDDNQYESNVAENESDTVIVPGESDIQRNAQYENSTETNTSQNNQQSVRRILFRNESYTNHYYVSLNGELRLERNYMPEC